MTRRRILLGRFAGVCAAAVAAGAAIPARGATAAAGWSVFKRGANTLCIGPMPGTLLIMR